MKESEMKKRIWKWKIRKNKIWESKLWKRKMRKIRRKQFVLFFACALMLAANTQNIWAYDYQMTGAYQDGKVTITALGAGQNINGYSTLSGYRVDYELTENFIAFSKYDGCDFYVGNNLNPSGGCHFAYKPNGEIWQQGALNLGAIYDGRSVGSAEPDANNTVRASFQVGSLAELPEYICYTYQPAGGAYLHISESYGHDHHVWYYQNLKNVTPQNTASIDTVAPIVACDVIPSGTTAVSNGRTWGSAAVLRATATDHQSRPGGMRFYKSGTEIHSAGNGANAESITEQYRVSANGNYQVKAFDQLGNESGAHTVNVDCIDTTAPTISSFRINKSDYCTSAILTVDSSDKESGLHQAAYSFNNGAWSSSNRFTVTENGTYRVKVRDAVGNEATQSITVTNIDRTVPTIHSVTGNAKKFCTENEIEVVASDSGSGLHKQAYSFHNGAWTESNKFTVKENGTYVVRVRDAVGNIAEQSTTISNVDREKPKLAADVRKRGEGVNIRDEEWTNEKFIHIDAADEKSGMARVTLQKMDEEFVKSFAAEEDGQKEIHIDTDSIPSGVYEITAYDVLGNMESARVTVDHVDNTPPVIESVTQLPIGDEKVRISVSANDCDGSGLSKEAYSFDNEETWQEDNFKDVDKNGDYEIVVRDNMGLTAKKSENVSSIVKKEEPDNGDHGGNGGSGDGDGSGSDGGNTGNNDSGNSNNPGNNDGGNGNDNDPGNDDGGTGNDNPNNNHDSSNSEADKKSDMNKSKTTKENTKSSKKPSSSEKTASDDRSYENFHEENTSQLNDQNKDNAVNSTFKEKMQEKLSSHEVEVNEMDNKAAAKDKGKKTVRKVAAAVLAAILVAGLTAFGLYFLLTALHYSCVVYEVSECNERKRLTRIFLKCVVGDWVVEVPDRKLGNLGTGRYVFVFKEAFVKECEGDYAVIEIDRKRIREEIREEIEVQVS